jgi:hypothetical protein
MCLECLPVVPRTDVVVFRDEDVFRNPVYNLLTRTSLSLLAREPEVSALFYLERERNYATPVMQGNHSVQANFATIVIQHDKINR